MYNFAARVREWFLTPRDWDQKYEAGDHRDVIAYFSMKTNDIDLAKQHLHDRAKEEDIQLEIFEIKFCEAPNG